MEDSVRGPAELQEGNVQCFPLIHQAAQFVVACHVGQA